MLLVLQGSNGKYSTKQSWVLYLPQDPTPSAVFYCTTQVYGAFIDLLVCVGGLIASAFNLGLGEWIGKDAKQTN